MAGRWTYLLAAGLALGAVACSGDDDSSPSTDGAPADGGTVTLEALADAADGTCPFPVGQAAEAAGLAGGATTGTVETAPPDTTASTGNTLDLPPVQRLDGVLASCTITADDGALDVLLLAGRLDVDGSAALALLPALAREAELTVDELQPIGEELPSLDLGALVDLPGDAAVALLRTSVDGASDAAVLAWSTDVSRAQVDAAAIALDRLLR